MKYNDYLCLSQVAELVDASRFYRLDGCLGEIADSREDIST